MFRIPTLLGALVVFVSGCAGTVAEPQDTEPACSSEFEECTQQYTASIVCLDGSCSCTVPTQGESEIYDCRNGAPDGMHNKALGLP
jgi:hypothetical protein